MAGTSRLAIDIALALQHRFRDVATVEVLHGGLKTGIAIAVDYRGHQHEFPCFPRGRSLPVLVDVLTHDIVAWMATVVKDDEPAPAQ